MSLSAVHLAGRRPLIIFLVAAILFALVAAARFVSDTLAPTTPQRPAPITQSDAALIEQMQARLQRNPNDADAYAGLGLAFLQQARLTAEPSLYTRADAAFDQALRRNPDHVDALFGKGILALALHDFSGALHWAEQARAINPFRAEFIGVMVDGLVELGRYPEAIEAAQTMVDLRPDANSYSRVSYLRELHGDANGAIEAMQTAARMSVPGSESWAWFTVHVGNLHLTQGNLEAAQHTYQQALALFADYPFAQAGLARVAAAQGNLETAIALYQPLSERLPLPEFLIALGDLYATQGDTTSSRRQYELVRVVQQLNAAAGMDVDLELALFEADHGDPTAALEMARRAYERRPTLYAADALAWALYKNGLGTRDALLHFHAGMIALAVGERGEAVAQLESALAINPHFSLLFAPIARAALEAALAEKVDAATASPLEDRQSSR
jgi:tetratricopeptide (TPR) repeat protein